MVREGDLSIPTISTGSGPQINVYYQETDLILPTREIYIDLLYHRSPPFVLRIEGVGGPFTVRLATLDTLISCSQRRVLDGLTVLKIQRSRYQRFGRINVHLGFYSHA
jgi:hypothetical protein